MICNNCAHGCHHVSAAAEDTRALPGIRGSGTLNLIVIGALGLAAWGIVLGAGAFLHGIFT